jgi:hypothetical protein
MSEAQLQKKCGVYARRNRVLVRKIHAEQRKGWPDLILVFPISGETVYVEMKNPNGKGTLAEVQKIERDKIRAQNASVYTCDSFDDFKRIIDNHLPEALRLKWS